MAPERTCVGCGKKAPRQELRRLVVNEVGEVAVDPKGRAPGRGAYLCGAGCLRAAAKRKAFGRAFRGSARQVDLEKLAAVLN
ncbi:MAG TPA: YlxR family protein [Myxococcaceae bacterium]